MFKYNRNTNYLGEMLIYTSFAILTEKNISFVILMAAYTNVLYRRIWSHTESVTRKLFTK